MKTDKVIDHIVDWLNSYCKQAGLKGFVVGVSGGIDSAVTSTLCAKTQKPVFVLNMPIFQAKDQLDRADQHIEWLENRFKNVRGAKIDLTPAFKAIQDCLPKDVQDPLSMANSRSRLRMVTLYNFATHHRMLVAGTGNKVEDFGVGFYTKYGDGGVDVSPIADLLKSQVYEIAKAFEIIKGIQSAAPTDGLWADNRTDESQMGASYDELEWAMAYENGKSTNERLDERKNKVLEIYRKFNRINQHKFQPIPVCRIPDHLLS